MSGYTKGPWLLIETPDEKMISSWHVQVGDERVSVFPYTRKYSECRQFSGFFTDQQKMADARLIAAAPDLMATAELAMIWWQEHQYDTCGERGEWNTYDDEPEFVAAARSAIAKAKGEAQ